MTVRQTSSAHRRALLVDAAETVGAAVRWGFVAWLLFCCAQYVPNPATVSLSPVPRTTQQAPFYRVLSPAEDSLAFDCSRDGNHRCGMSVYDLRRSP